MQEDEEKEVERQIRAALAGPSHPLRGDQVEMLLQTVRGRNAGDVPIWSLVLLCAGLFIIALVALVGVSAPVNGFAGASMLQIALLIPAVNLILSPLAAFVIVRKTR